MNKRDEQHEGALGLIVRYAVLGLLWLAVYGLPAYLLKLALTDMIADAIRQAR